MNYSEIENKFMGMPIGKDCQGNTIFIGDKIRVFRIGTKLKHTGILRYDPSCFRFMILFDDGENQRVSPFERDLLLMK